MKLGVSVCWPDACVCGVASGAGPCRCEAVLVLVLAVLSCPSSTHLPRRKVVAFRCAREVFDHRARTRAKASTPPFFSPQSLPFFPLNPSIPRLQAHARPTQLPIAVGQSTPTLWREVVGRVERDAWQKKDHVHLSTSSPPSDWSDEVWAAKLRPLSRSSLATSVLSSDMCSHMI